MKLWYYNTHLYSNIKEIWREILPQGNIMFTLIKFALIVNIPNMLPPHKIELNAKKT